MGKNEKISVLERLQIHLKLKKYFYLNLLVVILFILIFLSKYDFNVNAMLYKIDIILFSVIISFLAVITQMNSSKMISTASNDLEL